MKDVVFLLDIRRDFFNENEGICHIGEDVYVEKIYIEPKPKSVNDSKLKIFKEVKSFDEKNYLLNTVNQHKFSCLLHYKPYSKYFHERDYL